MCTQPAVDTGGLTRQFLADVFPELGIMLIESIAIGQFPLIDFSKFAPEYYHVNV